MKINCGINLSRLGKDVLKGKPKPLSSYIWVTASQSLKKPKR